MAGTETGISIQASDRERNIPDVDVKLLPTATMLNGVSATGKDIMTQIWGAESRIVYGTSRAAQINASGGVNFSRRSSEPSNTTPDRTKVYGVSLYTSEDLNQYEIPSLIYLANAMILDPYTVPVNSYLTKKSTYTIGSSDLSTYNKKTITGSAPDAEPGSIFTYDTVVTDDSGSISFVPDPDHLTDGTYQETVRKVQSSVKSGTVGRKAILRVSKQVPSSPTKVDFYSSLLSTFKLRKNQPFGINVSMWDPTSSWLKALSNNEESLFGTKDGPGQVSPLYSIAPGLRKNTVTFIEWGGESDSLMLVVYQKRGKIELYRKEVQRTNSNGNSGSNQNQNAVGGMNSPPNDQQQQQQSQASVETRTKIGERYISKSADSSQSNYLSLNLIVYTIGNQIVVADGEDALRAGVKAARHDNVAIFTLDRVVNAGEGPVKVTTYLGSSAYAYLQVVHVGQGVFTSPTVQLLQSGVGAQSPILTVDYEGRIGSGALTTDKKQHFKLPEGKDTFYEFLTDTALDAEISGDDGQVHYELTLTSNEEDGGDQYKRIYSPRVYMIQARVRPQTVVVGMNPTPQIDNDDVVRIEVDMACEGSSARVILNNRNLADCPPHSGGKYFGPGFVGVKPIQIKYGIKGDKTLSTRFTGYVTNRDFSLGDKGTKPLITLYCEDVSLKAKNTYAINLPIFDGWCQLGAFYYLAKEAGYGDDEIVFGRNGNTKLVDILQGDPSTMTGGCFSGHEGGIVTLSEKLHAPLPLPANKEQPYYMFQMGTTIWNCMQEIRKFSGFFLFANHLGQLVYTSPEEAFGTSDLGEAVSGYGSNSGNSSAGFIEHGAQKIGQQTARFAEVQKLLSAKHEPIRSKNHIVVIGYTFGGRDGTIGVGNPIYEIQSDAGWPFNVTNPNYVPWKAVTVLREPHWNDAARTSFIAAETFRRSNRPFMYISWSSFGQAGILPYDQATINESISAETGITGQNIVLTSIKDIVDANTMSFFSSYEGEIIGNPQFNFSPHTSGYTVS